jgi:hypothetical protein
MVCKFYCDFIEGYKSGSYYIFGVGPISDYNVVTAFYGLAEPRAGASFDAHSGADNPRRDDLQRHQGLPGIQSAYGEVQLSRIADVSGCTPKRARQSSHRPTERRRSVKNLRAFSI